MLQGCAEIGKWIAVVLHGAREAIKALESIHLFCVAEPRSVKRSAQYRKRFIVSLQRHGKRMSVFAAMGKGKPRRIGKAAGRAVHYFRDQRQ